jgi:hypothetical protein
MHKIGNPVLWLIFFMLLSVAVLLLRGHFSAEARARRRRERSNRPAISRKQGPTVRLGVNAGKPKGDRKA